MDCLRIGYCKKRQPLHEEGRELRLAIPLRNQGPGIAIAVSAVIETGSQDLVFGSNELLLGKVLPEDFSAVFATMVITPNTGFQALITVTWEETGDVERKSITSDVSVVPQKTDVDWPRLQYILPYTTREAKGEAFVGRKEKVLALANRMLSTPMEKLFRWDG